MPRALQNAGADMPLAFASEMMSCHFCLLWFWLNSILTSPPMFRKRILTDKTKRRNPSILDRLQNILHSQDLKPNIEIYGKHKTFHTSPFGFGSVPFAAMLTSKSLLICIPGN
jgi:hypothetical protein